MIQVQIKLLLGSSVENLWVIIVGRGFKVNVSSSEMAESLALKGVLRAYVLGLNHVVFDGDNANVTIPLVNKELLLPS